MRSAISLTRTFYEPLLPLLLKQPARNLSSAACAATDLYLTIWRQCDHATEHKLRSLLGASP